MAGLGGIDRRLLQNVDWPLLGAMGGLVILRATTLASLHIGRAGGNVAFRQLAWFTLGLFALVAVASVDYRRLVRLAPVFFVMGLVGLASVFVLGRTVSGARRWILLGPMSVQPSEVFKLCFVLMATWVLTSRWAQPVGKTTLALTVPVLVVPVALIVKQPDLGTALLLFPVLTALLVGAGIQLRLLGGFALAGLSALLLLRGFDIAASSREPVGRLIALGVTALFATQVLVNVGMVTGLLPVVGVPLPLMSYGGTSMLVSLTGLGLLLSVRMRQFQ